MRTEFFVVTLLAFAVMGLMFAGSGFNSAVGVDGSNSQLESSVNESSERVNPADGVEGARAGSDSSIVGIAIGGAQQIAGILVLVGYWPAALQTLGFPGWFATPVGIIAQLIVGIGLFQFATGRIYE